MPKVRSGRCRKSLRPRNVRPVGRFVANYIQHSGIISQRTLSVHSLLLSVTVKWHVAHNVTARFAGCELCAHCQLTLTRMSKSVRTETLRNAHIFKARDVWMNVEGSRHWPHWQLA